PVPSTETAQRRCLRGRSAPAAFLAQARAAVPTAAFETADLTSDALPPADLAYARYVLSHLPDPVGTLAGWRGGPGPGGRLVVEENLELRIHHRTFLRYEDAVARVVGGGRGERS